jgi:16S rRNA (cytosine1402-N4)-methyltransferase
MNDYHIPVLLKEVLDLLQVKKGKRYIDATLGGGGHTFEILNQGGLVLGIDWDKESIDFVKERQKASNFSQNLTLAQGNFSDLEKIALSNGFDKVSGIIFDLGISTHQLEEKNRGFSFLKEGPLDMRMDKSLPIKASDLINVLTKGELYEIFYKLGEERRAHTISNSIISARRIKPIQTTGELASVVQSAYGIRYEPTDFIKSKLNMRVFQALRIAVNNELGNVEKALPQALDLLESGGRVAVISFHSLEDRIVKLKFKEFQKEGMGKILTKKPISSQNEELSMNRRARSAKLRIFEKN